MGFDGIRREVDDRGDAMGTTERDLTGGRPSDTTQEVLGLLAEHVPLALLADLAAPSVPVSTEILESEGLPDDAWWETDETAAPDVEAVPPA